MAGLAAALKEHQTTKKTTQGTNREGDGALKCVCICKAIALPEEAVNDEPEEGEGHDRQQAPKDIEEGQQDAETAQDADKQHGFGEVFASPDKRVDLPVVQAGEIGDSTEAGKKHRQEQRKQVAVKAHQGVEDLHVRMVAKDLS